MAALLLSLLTLPLMAQTKPAHHHTVQVEVEDEDLTAAEEALQEQDYATAEQSLRTIVQSEPKNVRAWFDLGLVFNITARPSEATDAYRKVVALQPNSLEGNLNLALLLANAKEADAGHYLRICAKLSPGEPQRRLMLQAWLKLAQDLAATDQAGALDAAQQAAELSPDSLDARLLLANLYQQSGQSMQAEQTLRQAVAIAPDSPEAQEGLCHFYLKQNKFAEAEQSLRSYLALRPGNGRVHRLLGEVLAANGKTGEAEKEYKESLRLAADKPSAALELANLQFDQKHYEDARLTLEPALAQSPSNAAMHALMGRIDLTKSNYAAALREFKTAAELDPASADTLENLAMTASLLRNFPLTLQTLDARLKLAPETPYTLLLRATTLDNLHLSAQAEAAYQMFLTVAAGRFPKEEQETRARLKEMAAQGHNR
jgi:Tfp pilus assembly protein PilF